VFEIVNRLGPEADARGLVGWRDELTAALSAADTRRLLAAAAADNYEGVVTALLGPEATAQVDDNLLRDQSFNAETGQTASAPANLTFTPITPCRIVDTRLAGGAISGGSSRAFDARGRNLAYQGGGECADLGTDAAAIAINVTVANPAGRGFLTLYPEGESRPLASTINYSAETLTLANSTIIKAALLAGQDFRVYAETATEVVIDLLGVFGPVDGSGSADNGSGATDEALQVFTESVSATENHSGRFDFVSPTCPADTTYAGAGALGSGDPVGVWITGADRDFDQQRTRCRGAVDRAGVATGITCTAHCIGVR
jgi:hypothetical protein